MKEQGPLAPRGSLIPINTEDLSRDEIESAILQVLFLGHRAAVDETNVGQALWQAGEGIASAAVTLWANAFADQFGFTWERRRLFGDLLFSLAETTDRE